MAKQTFTTGQVLTAAQMTSLQQTAMGGGAASTKTASYVLVAADAGTTVQMNSASATTITVNTSLFTAGDVVFIQNIGAGVVTITAGTATVTTAGSLALNQWEGGQLFFNSASAAVFFDYVQTGATSPLTTKGDIWGFSTVDARIPIGSNNQVLTADSTQALGLKWASPSASGASFSLLNSGGTTLSGSTTTVSGISGQNTLLVIIQSGGTSAAGMSWRLRINTDSGTNYFHYGVNINNPSTYAAGFLAGTTANDTYYVLGATSSNAATTFNSGTFIYGANTTALKVIDTTGSGATGGGNATQAYITKGYYSGTSTVSSISIVSDGTMNAGKVFVYGSAV